MFWKKNVSRDMEMFDALVREHSAMLVTYLCSLTGHRAEAEDLAQEAFVRAYKRFDEFGAKGMNFAAWLRVIAKNLFIDKWRKRQAPVVVDSNLLEAADRYFQAMDRSGEGDTWAERVAFLRECLTSLSDHMRRVCERFYFEDASARSIAAEMGIEVNAVLKRLERSRESLRICVERKLLISGDK